MNDKVGFKSLVDTWADTTTPHGRLMLTVLGGLAEFERELIRARTGEGRKRHAPAHALLILRRQHVSIREEIFSNVLPVAPQGLDAISLETGRVPCQDVLLSNYLWGFKREGGLWCMCSFSVKFLGETS